MPIVTRKVFVDVPENVQDMCFEVLEGALLIIAPEPIATTAGRINLSWQDVTLGGIPYVMLLSVVVGAIGHETLLGGDQSMIEPIPGNALPGTPLRRYVTLGLLRTDIMLGDHDSPWCGRLTFQAPDLEAIRALDRLELEYLTTSQSKAQVRIDQLRGRLQQTNENPSSPHPTVWDRIQHNDPE